MKTKITVAMIMFIGFVLCSTVVAYMPVLIVRECPHCKAHVVQEDTLSGNTIGAKFYTDGKREAKMLPDHPSLAKCPVCRGCSGSMKPWRWTPASTRPKENSRSWLLQERKCLSFFPARHLPTDKELYVRYRHGGALTMPGVGFRIQHRPFPRSRRRISRPYPNAG